MGGGHLSQPTRQRRLRLTPLQPARAAFAGAIAADGAPLAPSAAVPWPSGLRYPAAIVRNRPEGGVMTSLRRILDTLAACAIAFAGPVVSAANLTIGLGTDVTALDPHYHNVTPNNNVGAHIFGYLVMRNEKSQLVPGLATEWKTIDPTTWEFKLRKGVKFHDGSDFTAADVVASIERVPTVPNSPSPFTAYSKQIREMIVVDPWTIRFRTATPYPLMPSDMTQILIISKAAAKATTDDFNSGKAAIGTGPYKLVRYAKGDRIELARNDAWWGGPTPWEKVTLRLLPQDASRVAALLSGDVQVIENVPTSDAAKLKQDKRLGVYRTVADRLIYLHMDSDRDVSPFVTDKAGKPLAKNPLKDPRVRKAISKAINRPAMVDKVMEGEAIASGQLVADFLFGATKNLKVEAYDPEGAKKLLAEAGYPDGFGITIHAPNNRYVNDAKIAQAVAQMLTRVGIDTKVVAMPSSTFFTQATDLKFSLMLLGWSTGTGEASSSLKALLMTYNRDKGYGTANRGRYSNTKVDALTEDALQTVDDVKREAYLQRATELAIGDTGVVPLHFQVNLWAARDGITYVPRTDENTLAWLFKPAARK
jgi:peptide/nickel transport system substrate-binding protein